MTSFEKSASLHSLSQESTVAKSKASLNPSKRLKVRINPKVVEKCEFYMKNQDLLESSESSGDSGVFYIPKDLKAHRKTQTAEPQII